MNENDTQERGSYEKDENRIREEAYHLWLSEGKPDGKAETHWAAAKEIVATRDSLDTTLTPVDEATAEPIEPAVAADVHGDMPGLTDQVDNEQPPSRARADRATGGAKPASARPARKPKTAT